MFWSHWVRSLLQSGVVTCGVKRPNASEDPPLGPLLNPLIRKLPPESLYLPPALHASEAKLHQMFPNRTDASALNFCRYHALARTALGADNGTLDKLATFGVLVFMQLQNFLEAGPIPSQSHPLCSKPTTVPMFPLKNFLWSRPLSVPNLWSQ